VCAVNLSWHQQLLYATQEDQLFDLRFQSKFQSCYHIRWSYSHHQIYLRDCSNRHPYALAYASFARNPSRFHVWLVFLDGIALFLLRSRRKPRSRSEFVGNSSSGEKMFRRFALIYCFPFWALRNQNLILSSYFPTGLSWAAVLRSTTAVLSLSYPVGWCSFLLRDFS